MSESDLCIYKHNSEGKVPYSIFRDNNKYDDDEYEYVFDGGNVHLTMIIRNNVLHTVKFRFTSGFIESEFLYERCPFLSNVAKWKNFITAIKTKSQYPYNDDDWIKVDRNVVKFVHGDNWDWNDVAKMSIESQYCLLPFEIVCETIEKCGTK
jgi:hypothetical protein